MAPSRSDAAGLRVDRLSWALPPHAAPSTGWSSMQARNAYTPAFRPACRSLLKTSRLGKTGQQQGRVLRVKGGEQLEVRLSCCCTDIVIRARRVLRKVRPSASLWQPLCVLCAGCDAICRQRPVSTPAEANPRRKGISEAAPRSWPRSETGGLWGAVGASGGGHDVATAGCHGEAGSGAPRSPQQAV